MELSKRASYFLKQSKREDFPLTEQEIRQCFLDNELPVFEPLIDFQLKYGGYIFNTVQALIKFSILKGIGGYPNFSNTAIIEYEDRGFTSPVYFFNCASTDYQMYFHLDEHGVYYDDYEAKASSFEKAIEHFALWNELQSQEEYELLFRDRRLQTKDIDQLLALQLIPEASDQYTLWFRNEYIFMEQRQGLTTLIVSNRYPYKERLLTLS